MVNEIKNKKNTEGGQIMIEAIVALSIIAIGIIGVFTLTSRSISLNRVTADRYVAVNLANEGIELVKNLIDRNIMEYLKKEWNSIPGFDGTGDYEIDYNDTELSSVGGDPLCFNPDSSGYYRYCEQDGDKETSFQRIITITEKDDKYKHIEVVSKVYWESRGAIYDFSVKDDFYDLQLFKYNINLQK
jgi:type II secretory pathway pseudopilin PulG